MTKLTLGIDSASSRTGIALLKGKKPVEITTWKTTKAKSLTENLSDFQIFLTRFYPVDLTVVERVSVRRNLHTVRMLAYFEAAAMMLAHKQGSDILHISPGQARKRALGDGSLTKQEVYDLYSQKYKLSPYAKGGNDESDALCLAYAGVRS